MAHQLKADSDLTKDPSSVPSIQSGSLQQPVSIAPGRLTSSSGLHRHLHSPAHIPSAHRHTHIILK